MNQVEDRLLHLAVALLAGGCHLRHPLVVPLAGKADVVGGAVRLEQRLLLSHVPVRRDRLAVSELLLRLQILLEELVVVGGISLRLLLLLLSRWEASPYNKSQQTSPLASLPSHTPAHPPNCSDTPTTPRSTTIRGGARIWT